LAKIFRRLPLLKQWQKARLRRVMLAHAISPQEFNNSQAQLGLAVAYSPDYFKWRGFHANFLVQIKGVKFWLCVDAVVRVGDVHFDTEEEFSTALTTLRRICSKLGYHEILFQTYPDSALDRVLSRHYQGFESWRVGYLAFAEGLDFGQYRPSWADQDSF
jgi:hypothetical protein